MTSERDILNAILRHDFPAFVQRCFQTLNPGQTLHMNWHIRALCFQLLACALGATLRLAVCMPPRSLKTICATKALPAYLIAIDPSLEIICASYSHDLAIAHHADFRRIIEASWYREQFPHVRASSGQSGGTNTQTEFRTSANGGRIATSVGGTLTGRGADIIIIDDPSKTDAAMSKADRDTVNAWFSNTVVTRLNNPSNGRIMIVMQRIHEDDLVGHVTDREADRWTILNIPAIAQNDETYQLSDNPNDLHHRREGDVIDPRHQDRVSLEGLRQSMGSRAFYAQFLQDPQLDAGDIIERGWFGYYGIDHRTTPADAIVMSWDTSFGANEGNDYSVCTEWEIRGDKLLLTHVFRAKLDYPALRSVAIERATARGAHYVLIEKAASGLGLAPDIRQLVPGRVVPVPPRGDKRMRFEMASSLIESGRVLLPDDNPKWLDPYLRELLGFPGGRYDDQVDSTSQFLNWVRKRQFEPRQEGQRPRRARPNRQRIRRRPRPG